MEYFTIPFEYRIDHHASIMRALQCVCADVRNMIVKPIVRHYTQCYYRIIELELTNATKLISRDPHAIGILNASPNRMFNVSLALLAAYHRVKLKNGNSMVVERCLLGSHCTYKMNIEACDPEIRVTKRSVSRYTFYD